MTYHLNYNFVWLYFDKFYWGLLLGLELAFISILIGAAIALPLALIHVDGPRLAAAPGHGLCRVHPQSYRCCCWSIWFSTGCRASADSNTTRPRPSSSRCRSIPAPTLSRYSAPASMRCRGGCIDAGKAIGLTPLQRLIYVRLPTMLRVILPALSNQTSSRCSRTPRSPSSSPCRS